MTIAKNTGKTDAVTVSNFILKNYGPMSHLKLQKLLYYCAAYHLAYLDAALFDEDFQAWVHGPVCRPVYDSLKVKSILYSDIAFDNSSDPDKALNEALTTTQLGIIKDILGSLSVWSDLELEAATHKEQPWLTARKGYAPAAKCEVIISKEEMMHFYKTELESAN